MAPPDRNAFSGPHGPYPKSPPAFSVPQADLPVKVVSNDAIDTYPPHSISEGVAFEHQSTAGKLPFALGAPAGPSISLSQWGNYLGVGVDIPNGGDHGGSVGDSSLPDGASSQPSLGSGQPVPHAGPLVRWRDRWQPDQLYHAGDAVRLPNAREVYMAVGDSIGESPSPTMPSWRFMGLTAKADARWQYTHPYGPGELAVCKDVLYRATTSHANLWPVTHPTAWEPLTVPLTDSPGEFLCPIVSCWGCGSAFAPVSVTPYNGKMLNVFFECVGCGLGMGVPVKPAPDPVLGEDFDEVRLVYFKRAKGS